MRIYVDGKEYLVDGEKAMLFIKSFYLRESEKMDNKVIDTGGKKIDFGRKSIIRIGMKTAMVPFVIPMINLLYKLRGLEPPKHTKHEDLIDWMVVKMLEFGAVAEKDLVIHAVSKDLEGDDSGVRLVESVSTLGSDIFNQRRFQQRIQESGDQLSEEQQSV